VVSSFHQSKPSDMRSPTVSGIDPVTSPSSKVRARLPPFNGNEPVSPQNLQFPKKSLSHHSQNYLFNTQLYNSQLMAQCIPRMIIDLPALDADGVPVADDIEIAAQQAALDYHLVDSLYKQKWRGGAPVALPKSSSRDSVSK
jgi:hypothetical protein